MFFLSSIAQPFSVPWSHFHALWQVWWRSYNYNVALSIMGILLTHTIPDISRHFPHTGPTRFVTSSSQPPFSLISEPRYLNVSACFSIYFFLSDISAPLTCLVHTMTSVLFASTLNTFFSNDPCHSTHLLSNSSALSANISNSSAYSSSHNTSFLPLSLRTSSTNTNRK